MQQFRMTEERLDLSRNDISDILKSVPEDSTPEEHVSKALENLGLSDVEIQKVLDNLDSY